MPPEREQHIRESHALYEKWDFRNSESMGAYALDDRGDLLAELDYTRMLLKDALDERGLETLQ